MTLLPLAIIPLCSLLNHERGQGHFAANRVLSVVAMGFLYGLMALIDHPARQALLLGGAAIAGLLFWAVWTWGDGFLAISGQDTRDYTRMPWLCRLCDALTGVTPQTPLTREQCLAWGTLYMTARGLFLIPLFAGLACLLHRPEAAILGVLGASQGVVYRASPTVYVAEFIFGGVIGALLAATLLAF